MKIGLPVLFLLLFGVASQMAAETSHRFAGSPCARPYLYPNAAAWILCSDMGEFTVGGVPYQFDFSHNGCYPGGYCSTRLTFQNLNAGQYVSLTLSNLEIRRLPNLDCTPPQTGHLYSGECFSVRADYSGQFSGSINFNFFAYYYLTPRYAYAKAHNIVLTVN